MGLLKRAGDLVYTIRFLKLLVTNFEDTEAYKLGLIDEKGKRLKKSETSAEKNAYTPFHRLVFNIKKLIPMGKIGSYASALYLIKEQYGLSERQIEEALAKSGVDLVDILSEGAEWFVTNDGQLSPGSYKLAYDKDELVNRKDFVRVASDCYPVSSIFGINIYEVTHVRTGQKLFVSSGELLV